MSTNKKGGAKKRKSVRKYAEGSGLNAAGLPIANQLDNARERPIIPPSRMAQQAGQTPYLNQHSGFDPSYGEGPGPTALGPGYMFPGPATPPDFMHSHAQASNSAPALGPAFGGPTPGPSQSVFQVSAPPSSAVTPSSDIYWPSQSQAESHFLPSINVHRHGRPVEDGQLAIGTFDYADSAPLQLRVTGMDEAILHERRPLRFRTAPYPSSRPNRQIMAQPTIAPYAQFRGPGGVAESVGLLKLRPGELIRGVEFSTGVIRAVESSFRDVRKRSGAGVRLPPPPTSRPPATTATPSGPPTMQAATRSEPQAGPSSLLLVSTASAPAATRLQVPSMFLGKDILDQARDATKRFVLSTNAMPTRVDLLSVLTSAALGTMGNQLSAQEWTQMNEGNVKKLSDTASYIRSIFRDYAAHNVQDVFQLRETTAAQNGLSEAEWKRAEVNRLLKDFVFLSADTQHPLDSNSGNMMISNQITNLVSDVLFLEDLHRQIDVMGTNFVVTSALAATTYYWALEQYSRGFFTPLDFTVDKYTPVYSRIEAILCSISGSESFVSFTQRVVQRGRSLLDTSHCGNMFSARSTM